MNNYEDIIIKPYVTEKSNMEVMEGKYTFIVKKDSTKAEIRKACESLFNVKVLSVNVQNYSGKMKRMGVHEGRRAAWKKAIIKIDTEPKPDVYYDEKGKQVAADKKYKDSIEEYGFLN